MISNFFVEGKRRFFQRTEPISNVKNVFFGVQRTYNRIGLRYFFRSGCVYEKDTNNSVKEENIQQEQEQEQEQKGKESGESSQKNNVNHKRKRQYQSSKDLKREKYANWFYLTIFIGSGLFLGFLTRNWDSEEERKKNDKELKIENGYSAKQMWQRLSCRIDRIFTFFSEPASQKLLPPPLSDTYRRPLTLVLTLDDFLVHSFWDSKNGWRVAKRPGLDYFLGYLSQYYEIVIFSSNYQMNSEKTVAKLDPYHAYISYALFRESCRYKKNKLVKDLSRLNRDLEKTIIVDFDEQSFSEQPENAIKISPWKGAEDDYLIKLISLLEYIATLQTKDVRTLLASFPKDKDMVETFKQRENKLREKWISEYPENKNLGSNAGTFIAKLLGLTNSSLYQNSKMPLDVIREHGQLQYKHFQDYLKKNAHKILEEEAKLKSEFGKTTLNKLISEGAPSV